MARRQDDVIDLTRSDDESEAGRAVHSPRQPPLSRLHDRPYQQRHRFPSSSDSQPARHLGGSAQYSVPSTPLSGGHSGYGGLGSLFNNAANNFGSLMGLSSSGSSGLSRGSAPANPPPPSQRAGRMERTERQETLSASTSLPDMRAPMAPFTASQSSPSARHRSSFQHQQHQQSSTGVASSSQSEQRMIWLAPPSSPSRDSRSTPIGSGHPPSPSQHFSSHRFAPTWSSYQAASQRPPLQRQNSQPYFSQQPSRQMAHQNASHQQSAPSRRSSFGHFSDNRPSPPLQSEAFQLPPYKPGRANDQTLPPLISSPRLRAISPPSIATETTSSHQTITIEIILIDSLFFAQRLSPTDTSSTPTSSRDCPACVSSQSGCTVEIENLGVSITVVNCSIATSLLCSLVLAGNAYFCSFGSGTRCANRRCHKGFNPCSAYLRSSGCLSPSLTTLTFAQVSDAGIAYTLFPREGRLTAESATGHDSERNRLHCIVTQKPRVRQHLSSFDDLAELHHQVVDPSADAEEPLKVRIKLYRDNQRRPEGRAMNVRTISLKTPNTKVPKYRFHHVEIAKNILSPNTPLKFIPHFRDLEDGSEDKKKFDQWIEELESMEVKSGFDTSKRFDKWASTRTSEYAKVVSIYLERWISSLGIDNCSKTTLIRYMASELQNESSFTPKQKNSLLSSCGESAGTPRATMVASMFTDAFNRVFEKKHVSLYDVLRQDEAFENMIDPRKATKDAAIAAAAAAAASSGGTGSSLVGRLEQEKENHLDQIQQYLGTYSMLGCMICHTHSCEHGEFDFENIRRCFSIEDCGGKLWMHVEQRREAQARARLQQHQLQQKAISSGSAANGSEIRLNSALPPPCENQCFRSYDIGDPAFANRAWTENETTLLRSLQYTLADSSVNLQCTAAALLGRFCWEVYRQMKELGMHTAQPYALADRIVDPPAAKPVSWYDRHRKVLNGDWSDHTYTHIHALREQREPCNHDGPCTVVRGCPCAEAKLLCERFCRCTSEKCAFKFTGCACHAAGKTCYARQKEGKPCICVQLNRECDPVLCGGCGSRERADPRNRDNDALHGTGCQNVALQRGKSKTVLLGKSQLDGCGYGLFTAEDISAEEFVIEYIGELITHDEGVRREARRGDVFNQESNASYLFTLLEQDGIWVDAAIYGNLSRYINHASEQDKRGCNITPKILYVNGEFRIRFAAMRDIKAGEELFFNYGENFPNLTKKLLEDKASVNDEDDLSIATKLNGTEGGRGQGAAKRRNRKTQNAAKASRNGNGRNGNSTVKRAKAKGARKEAPPAHAQAHVAESVDEMDVDDDIAAQPKRGMKRKQRHHLYDEDDEMDEMDDEEHETAPVRYHRRGAQQHESDDEFQNSPSRRSSRTRRRRAATTTVTAAATTTTTTTTVRTAAETGAGSATEPAIGITAVVAAGNEGTKRRKDHQPELPSRHDDQHNDADDDDANHSERLRSGTSRLKMTGGRAGGSGNANGHANGQAHGSGSEPPRKRPRTANGDGDATAVDSDEPLVAGTPLRKRTRLHPEHQHEHQEQEQHLQHHLQQQLEQSGGGGTDDDQGSIMSASQFYGQRNGGSTNGHGGLVVADSDEEDGEDSVDRSQRRRQKPARYRSEAS
ncbi:set domain containing protein [Grosmannia clavigera kw1407]|uniref:Set domain containing protein n=1 Tax=Grosmannia clavigera (strain kw1407 / UAMH 11150) TaxID=655863 RepID=F0XU90_GROCL|nr:set domain containing protein [Grosmannia clavigera kw1407]EFW99026.1 set domain containing protein [Grosmannia clavigera kw1407]